MQVRLPFRRTRATLLTGALLLPLLATGAGCAATTPPTDRSAATPEHPALAPQAAPAPARPLHAAVGQAAAEEQSGTRLAAQRHTGELQAAEAARQAAEAARQAAEAARRALETARHWGLATAPLAAPAKPAERPELTPQPGVSVRSGLPLVYRVPTDRQVVFLTVDDGAVKDTEFSRMAQELGVPFTAFVSGYLARGGYDYFRALQEQGVRVNNHTVNHKDLRRLDEAHQRREICDQQDELEQELGTRPVLFRPPYGEFTDATLRAAASCGITAVAIWNEEAFPDRIEYRYADQRLHPGDIILTHFLGPAQWHGATMADMLRRVIRTATDQGFALARLDDYLGRD
ncbi:polysaccharide deacetylase [Kitasatospora sp. MMS16-BH015]|uniref:polysaccharide deacetylase family protein n=1 Tax=Kitasatospora sp. MMS16-BH015 TaxID=2018025 RepID=UPI000CA3B7EA|nr:polysaccharide deacetylase family protein [Kitasatospora sp. MMS16-BH015]AUG75126.1 polysaccharide deacetylase [Kitasatospora sp. MMS16-BH015]